MFQFNYWVSLTIRFLESSTGRSSTILLGFAPTRITDEHVTVVLHKSLSQFVLGLFIDILCVVGNHRLGNRRANGINLRSDTSTLDADANIEVAELVLSNNKNRLEDLQAESSGLDKLNGLSIDLDQTASLLGKGNCGCIFLPVYTREGGSRN
jgi:hypothetical protein